MGGLRALVGLREVKLLCNAYEFPSQFRAMEGLSFMIVTARYRNDGARSATDEMRRLGRRRHIELLSSWEMLKIKINLYEHQIS
jgi:hypothetical protein